MLTPMQCHEARMARDRRYDGLFFTAVKTTGIYCRSICPAMPPLEKNVEYFDSAVAAAQAGYRPCLRCRPDSAPGSPAWLGKNTTLRRAQRLIDEGALIAGSIARLAERLGVTDRYLRKLFQDELGLSPKAYSLYQQCLLAKKLLHETRLPVTHIALASGFGSIRRFNDCFKQHFSLAPTQIRKQPGEPVSGAVTFSVSLAYRPPYHWAGVRNFYASRLIEGLEWLDNTSYGRTFQFVHTDDVVGEKDKTDGTAQSARIYHGWFTARHDADNTRFIITISLDDLSVLPQVLATIRRCLDLDADSSVIDTALERATVLPLPVEGLRLPGIWSPFEAGIRAILGQQVSVKAARNLAAKIVAMNPENTDAHCFFPTPEQLLEYDLNQLGMPERRRQTLREFARFAAEHPLDNPDALLALPGIGPWTVNYLRMRGCSDPDIFLDGDLGVKKALEHCECQPALAAPWRSYLTLHLWNTL